MKNKQKLLFIYSHYSTFVQADYEILSTEYDLTKYHFEASKKLIPFVSQLLKIFFFLIVKGWSFDYFFIWFADYYSLFPVLFAKLTGRKSFIVSGGFDAVSIPDLNYGLFHKKDLRYQMGRLSYQYCNKIFPVDKTLIKNQNNYSSGNLAKSGIMNFCDLPEERFETIPTGYDPEIWTALNDVERKDSVITVASASNMTRWKLKGGDFLVELAQLLPDIDFYFYGVQKSFKPVLEKIGIPTNFHICGPVKSEELPSIYSQHKVYAQFSISEGLPNVLCEAMLCGCIPVGSHVNGIPNAIGETGFVLEKEDSSQAKELILKALSIFGSSAPRDRIRSLFSIHNRQEKLLQSIKSTK